MHRKPAKGMALVQTKDKQRVKYSQVSRYYQIRPHLPLSGVAGNLCLASCHRSVCTWKLVMGNERKEVREFKKSDMGDTPLTPSKTTEQHLEKCSLQMCRNY